MFFNHNFDDHKFYGPEIMARERPIGISRDGKVIFEMIAIEKPTDLEEEHNWSDFKVCVRT